MNSQLKWKYPNAIVKCEWLHDRIKSKNIRVYDCTMYLHYTDEDPSKPYDVESGYEKYKESHIPNAAFLDLQKEFSDNLSSYKFTLPRFNILAESFKEKGIGDPFHIVLYSRNGLQWATRIWWMIYVLGYNNVSILDGGFDEWNRLGYKSESKIKTHEKSNFEMKVKSKVFVDKKRVLNAINNDSCLLLNALTKDLHFGKNKRYGRPGRIPNSLNVPFHELINNETGLLKSPEEAEKIFKQKNITSDLKVINYCGGGIAATLDAFVLLQLGFKNLQIYDNSMSEWAIDKNLPIEKN